MKVAILVVIYDKQLDGSNTLKSLLNVRSGNSFLTIVNNGPHILNPDSEIHFKLNEKFKEVEVIEYTNNKPLSILYNDFIASMDDADYYILMDDDSILTDEYTSMISSLGKNDFDILVPRIKSIKDDCIYYPIEHGSVIVEDRILDSMKVFSIGSGMIISKCCVEKILAYFSNVFDERYAFYGVDMSIFRRVRIISRKIKGNGFLIVSKSMILHSLSRVDSPLTFFRASERLIDASLTFRNYFSVLNAIDFFRILLKCYPTLGLSNSLKISFTAFFNGCHFRIKKWNSR